MSTKIFSRIFNFPRWKRYFLINMFQLNFYQIAYITKLIVFLSLYRLLFPVALEQNLQMSYEYLLIFCISTFS